MPFKDELPAGNPGYDMFERQVTSRDRRFRIRSAAPLLRRLRGRRRPCAARPSAGRRRRSRLGFALAAGDGSQAAL
eukprot:7390363-Prymnesium_polylepis.1